MVSSRKAPRSFSFSYITAALKLEKLKSLNPSLMNENSHYKHMLTQKETDRREFSVSLEPVFDILKKGSKFHFYSAPKYIS